MRHARRGEEQHVGPPDTPARLARMPESFFACGNSRMLARFTKKINMGRWRRKNKTDRCKPALEYPSRHRVKNEYGTHEAAPLSGGSSRTPGPRRRGASGRPRRGPCRARNAPGAAARSCKGGEWKWAMTFRCNARANGVPIRETRRDDSTDKKW